MRFTPSFCDACSSSGLTPASAEEREASECPECGAEMRTLPGPTYEAQHRALYAALASIVGDAGLSAINASQLLGHVDAELLRRSPGATLIRLSRALPPLASLATLLNDPSVPLRLAEALLIALLTAHATRRRDSGVLAVVESSEKRRALPSSARPAWVSSAAGARDYSQR